MYIGGQGARHNGGQVSANSNFEFKYGFLLLKNYADSNMGGVQPKTMYRHVDVCPVIWIVIGGSIPPRCNVFICQDVK